jgi:hypothetical protein
MAKAASSRGGAPPGRTFWGLHLQPCVQEGHRLDYSRELEADTRIVTAAIGGACARVCVRAHTKHALILFVALRFIRFMLACLATNGHTICHKCWIQFMSFVCWRTTHLPASSARVFIFVACFFPAQRRRPTLRRLATVARG